LHAVGLLKSRYYLQNKQTNRDRSISQLKGKLQKESVVINGLDFSSIEQTKLTIFPWRPNRELSVCIQHPLSGDIIEHWVMFPASGFSITTNVKKVSSMTTGDLQSKM